ncbi:dethiobiotin synthase [Marinicella sp. S1101]|uniref:dethiobiotin synthase n=1 Tax=Marinicella marina TaxID=2996016 RepID=UPI002260E08D|nr:dethiobiotin synthase [Marinicella marina]MCX7553305.1 dethiobiotin synthase [Marinicella marina]MDJ1139037.1 dethiobiotin synthase [Marinicella marina]
MLIKQFVDIPSCFITATDTDAGKTYISCQILKAWKNQGLTVGAFKPIASGAIWQGGQLVSEDALELAKVTGQTLSEINPYTFEHPASPHIADVDGQFNMSECLDLFQQLNNKYDRVLVEGVGGWCVPLSENLMLKDLAIAVQLPVVMVARIGLGCINHSLLTIEKIKQDSDLYHGWIANVIEAEFTDIDSNIQAIVDRS